MSVLRWLGALVLASVISMIVIMAIIFGNMVFWPLPAELADGTMAPDAQAIAMAAYVRDLPLTPKLVMVAAYAVAMLTGGVVAGLISRTFWSIGITLAVIFTVFAFLNALSIPMAMWLKVLNVAIIAPLALIGTRIGSRIGS